jgi:hypothetical protein
MKEFVIDDNEQMNAALLEKLKKVQDPNTFLEAVLTHLYGKAVKQEENVVSRHLNTGEKHEVDAMVEKVYTDQKKR